MTTPESQTPKMTSGRPMLPQPTPQPNPPFERALMLLAFVGVAVGMFMIALAWAQIPATIPTHFGANGKPNAYGDKATLLALPMVSFLLVALLLWIGGKPHLFNYPWKITDENMVRQYHAARVLMRVLAFLFAWIFAYVTYATVQVALGDANGLDTIFLIVALLAVFGTLLGYILIAVRLR